MEKKERNITHSLTTKISLILLLNLTVSFFHQNRPLSAGPFGHLMEPRLMENEVLNEKKILENSQISYRAEGGFTGVESYGVIISCVKGKISVMKSIYDPRLQQKSARVRNIGSLEKSEYLQLWQNLHQQALFKLRDSAPITMDITDEFTNHFYAKIGDELHQFQVVGISRPEASRYFAIRELIDNCVGMKQLWEKHESLARHLDAPTITQSAELSHQ